MVGMNGRSLSGGGGGGGGSYGGDSTTTSTNTTNGYRSSGGSLGDGNGAPLERTRSGDISTDDESGANRSSESRIPSRMYVRALYNYSTEDETSLSFNSGDVIQVLKQLDSGWWDGIVHGQRGWFPSNYCQVLNSNDYQNGGGSALDDSDDLDEDDSYDEYDDDDEEDDENDLASPGLPLEGTDADNKDDEAAFWIPQATPDGRLYYFNTNTGVYRSELPLDTPGNMNETGPRDRQNVGIPESTKPPVEMLANGYEREEREYPHHGEGDSESEREGMNGMNGMNVSFWRGVVLSNDSDLFYRDINVSILLFVKGQKTHVLQIVPAKQHWLIAFRRFLMEEVSVLATANHSPSLRKQQSSTHLQSILTGQHVNNRLNIMRIIFRCRNPGMN